MKFSEAWLRELVDPDLSTQALIDQLTMAGLEVDGFEPVAVPFSNVVVGEILSTEKHPDADKLVVCTVRDAEGEHQVVCGAPNARAGIKVPFAQVGAKLDDFKIKKAKLRGVESFGMLCSERELGISENHEGLMELPADAPTGEDVRSWLKLDDAIIDLDLTPNRSDCLGMTGLARETGLVNRLDVTYPDIQPVAATIEDTFPVSLACPNECPRFVGRVVRGINPSAASPLWLKEKLRRSGLRSIDPVVDITNYIMMELNHPMHAYDLDKLQDGIVVRLSEAGENVDLLDGSSVKLDAGTVLITDGNEPVGMGGIMGGMGSSVTSATTNLFLECAFFTPEAIAGKARSYGMHTDASHRFERGVDWQGQMQAIERATQLLIDIAGGEAGPLVDTVETDYLPKVAPVHLRAARVTRLLGVAIPDHDIEDMLRRLEFPFSLIEGAAETTWEVSAPSHRFDIAIEADLIEEICRVYGYNTVEARVPVASLTMAPLVEGRLSQESLRDQMVSRDYQEAMTYGFVDAGVQAKVDPEFQPVELQNPLSSEMSVMRTSLMTGLIRSVVYNLNRQHDRVRLFEIGLRFRQVPNQPELEFSNIRQEKVLTGVATGPRFSENWGTSADAIDFFDVKGDVESLLAMCGANRFSFRAATHPAMHPGQCAEIVLGDRAVGVVGMISPALQDALDLRQPAFAFEIEVDPVLERGLSSMTALSRYPEVRRDIAVLVDRTVPASDIVASIRGGAGRTLKEVVLFDVYEGEGVPKGMKSIGVGMTFQRSDGTLTDEQTNSAVNTVLQHLSASCGAILR